MTSAITRRNFIGAVGAGAVFILGFRCADGKVENVSKGSAKKKFQANAFISVDSDGLVIITVPKPDSGQGPRTSLAMILAEELGVDWSHIRVEQAPTDDAKYGGQGVGGSATIRQMFQPLRMAGATAASMFRHAAAQAWSCDAASCSLEGGHAVNKTLGKSMPIGDLVELASTMPTSEITSIVPRSPADYQIIGKPTKRVDNPDVVRGKAIFGLDVRVPGRKVAVIVRPRVFGGSVVSFDDSDAKKVNGFISALQVNSGVAVVAENTGAALKAADALKVKFDDGPNASLNSSDITEKFKAAVQPFPDGISGSKVIEATYELPYLSHATMEPMNCTAVIKDGKCEVWVPTQQPEGARGAASSASGISKDNTIIHVTLVGGGFGRRLSNDYVSECVDIAKRINQPVQLVWTRTDDLQHDNYRPATFHAMKGATDADGNPSVLYHQLIQPGRRGNGSEWRDAGSMYALSAKRIASGVSLPIPTGAWRSVENTYMQFVQECFFDELCHAGGKDPLKARLAMIKDDKLHATLVRAAELAGWGTPLPSGIARGVACFNGYGSVITQIAEVDCTGKQIKVRKMVAVVDCGLAVNPLGVEAQIQGAMMDAVSTTLHAAITIKGGGVAESNWDGFQWGRMEDAPHMVVEIFSKPENNPGGMGEVGYPAAGPAIANAVMAATGKRIRKLPIRLADLA